MKFMPRSRVIWGGTLMTLMTVLAAAEKDEKCSDYTAAAAGGELLMRGRRLLRSKRPNCLRLIKTSGDTFSAPNICFLHFLWWRPSHICRTFMTKFFIGFCICLCHTLCVWHTLWSPLIIHSVSCLFCLGTHLCVNVHCTCSAVWNISPWPKHNTNFTLANTLWNKMCNTLCNKQTWTKVCFVLPEGCYWFWFWHWLLNIMKFVIVCS